MKHLLLTTIAAVVLVGCWTSIYKAAKEGQIEEVKKLLPAGADVNTKTKFMETPLHFAAENGQKEVAELLIDKGADVNAKIVTGRKKGMTPLAIANMFSSKEIADLLRKHGAK